MELPSKQTLCRTLFAFLAFAGYLQAQTLKQTATIDLPGPKGERFDYLTMDVPGVLRGFNGQRHEAGDGATNPSQKDCHDCVARVEERSKLRRPTFETTNSLSVFDRVRSILDF